MRLGGDDGRRFERIRGDKAHPASQGYTCEKALRLDHYQNGRDRLTHARCGGGPTAPSRRSTGTPPSARWPARFAAVRDAHGGESIFYYGGGGQGNHLGGAYSGATLRALGARYRSNALAQEKTGEFWVNGQHARAPWCAGDFEHAEVALFVGKNPWQSHGIPHARTTLKEIANDPERSLIVIDPRRTETAELADIHLQVRPGTDAWCLAALVAVLVQEGLVDRAWLAEHAAGLGEVEAAFGAPRRRRLRRGQRRPRGPGARGGPAHRRGRERRRVRGPRRPDEPALDAGQLPREAGLAADRQLRQARRAVRADGGGGAGPRRRRQGATARGGRQVSPVVGARIISGLVPCNVIADEILTDHPARYRAMLVESGNPAHSLADSSRMREALDALDLVVVIDVAMTETARLADYVLPAPTQYEK